MTVTDTVKEMCGKYPQATILFIIFSPFLLFFTPCVQRAVDDEMQPSNMIYFYFSAVFETLVVVKLASSVWCDDEKPLPLSSGDSSKPKLVTLRSLFPRHAIKNNVTKKHMTCVVAAVVFELIALISGLELYDTTGRGPQADLIVISLDHPQYALVVGAQNQEGSHFGLVLFGVCQFIGCLFIINKLYIIIDPPLGGKAVYAAAFIVLITLGGRANGHLSPGMQGIQALSETAWRLVTRVAPELHDLYQADQGRFQMAANKTKINVLIMMNESINRRIIYTLGKNLVPNLHRFLDEQGNAGNIFDFPYGVTQSGVTEVSINSFAQGMYPTDADVGSRPNPSLFYYAKENCFNTTAIYSAHTLSYGNMDTFMVDTLNTDVQRHRGGLGAHVVLDFCMDDRELLQYFKSDIGTENSQFTPVHGFSNPPPVIDSEAHRTEPWFAVFHSCGTHLPGFVEEGDTPSEDRWFNSIWRWDSVFGELLNSIDLENTVLIITSDHGHNLDDQRKFARSWSFRTGDLHVPFIVYIPPALARDHPEIKNVLEQNVYRSVTPIDIYPTVRNILRLTSQCPHDAALEAKPKKLNGVDLTSADAGGRRHILSTNTGILRYWSTAPFALTQDHMQLIWDDQRKTFLLYDIVDYTGEDMWQSLSHVQQQHWIRKAKAHPHFMEILLHSGSSY